MLDNYSINEDGLIFQIEKKPFIYDINYVETRYDTYGELNNYMSNLRLGYVIGSIKEPITSILDVGYGNGSFLNNCSKIIPKCYGYDITNYKLSDKIIKVDDWMDINVDVLTFFDVLEHFDDPYIIKNCKSKYIVLSLPWCHYLDDNWFENWKHRRINEHLWFFNEKNIYNFAQKIGFEVINICDIEDTIRGRLNNDKNILTVTLKKI